MARIRSMKPDAFTSLTLSDVERGVRWTFAGLWTHCDDEGRAEWEPRLLKAAIYPVDDSMTPDAICADMKELDRIGAVCFYSVAGKNYVHVPSWSMHQHPNRKVDSKLPPCPVHDVQSSTDLQSSEPAVSPHVQSTPVVVVVDGDVDVAPKGEPRKRGVRIPDDWKPTTADIEWQRRKAIPDALARREFEKFGNYWRAKSGANAVKLDWSMVWQNWLLEAQARASPEPDAAARAKIAARAADPLASAR